MHPTYAAALDELLNGIDEFDAIQFAKKQPTPEDNIAKKLHYDNMINNIQTKYNISDRDIVLLTMKLREDRMAILDENEITMRMTFKGRDFLAQHDRQGYVKDREFKIQNRKRIVRNENALAGYTIVLAYGTVGLVVAELLIHYPDILKNLYRLFCGC